MGSSSSREPQAIRKKLEDVNSREQDRDRDGEPTLGNTPQRKASIPYCKDNGKDKKIISAINSASGRRPTHEGFQVKVTIDLVKLPARMVGGIFDR